MQLILYCLVPLTFLICIPQVFLVLKQLSSEFFFLWFFTRKVILPSTGIFLTECGIKCLISWHSSLSHFSYLLFVCRFIYSFCILDKTLACPSLLAGACSDLTRRTRWLREAVIKALKTEVIGELAIYVLRCRSIGSQVCRACLWGRAASCLYGTSSSFALLAKLQEVGFVSDPLPRAREGRRLMTL